MLSDPVTAALIGAVFSVVVGIVGAVSGFVLARRMQPSAIRASDASAAESLATAAATVQATGAKYVAGQGELFDRWEKSERSKLEILTEFGALKTLVISLQGENTQLKVDFGVVTQRAEAAETRALGCEMEVVGYKTRYDALELRNQDISHRLELAEAEIISLKAAALEVSATNAANAAARLVTANTAAIAAAGGAPVSTDAPVVPPEAATPPAPDPPA